MRAYREHLSTPNTASWTMLNRRLDDAIPFQWHHHPEFELTLTLNSQGQRFIGDHVGSFQPGQLIMTGPNLPQNWISDIPPGEAVPLRSLVIQFPEAFIEEASAAMPEMEALRPLLEGAARSRYRPGLS